MTMLRHGTTLAECKSGYGLVTDDEIKLLRVLQRVKKEVPLDIVMNLLAAHSVPVGYTSEEATQMIINEMIPKAIALKEKGELDIELIDISNPKKSRFLEFHNPRLLRIRHLRRRPDRAHHERRPEIWTRRQLPRRRINRDSGCRNGRQARRARHEVGTAGICHLVIWRRSVPRGSSLWRNTNRWRFCCPRRRNRGSGG